MKTRHAAPLLLALAIAVPPHVSAQNPDQQEEGAPEKRQAGFVLGFGAGGGLGWMSVGGDSDTNGGFIGQIRLGRQTSKGLQVFVEADFQAFRVENPLGFEDFVSTYLLGALQFYLGGAFYLRPALGVQFRDWSGEDPVTDFDTGLAIGLSAGYEFQMGNQFTVSPELIWRYALIGPEGGVDTMLLGVQLVASFYP